MSTWRKEATKKLPELQHIIDAHGDGSPTKLWKKLHLEFKRLCKQDPPPVDLLRRLWQYAQSCMRRRDNAAPAATMEFCERLIDTRACRKLLPQIMCRQDYEQVKGVLLCRNTEQDYQTGIACFDKAATK
jgi:hypothetical protein